MRFPGASLGATVALTLVVVLPASAQDTSHPAGIYVGTCPVPGNQLVSLWDASPSFLVDGEADAGPAVGTTSGYPVEGSVTIVEMPLTDLVASEHAILVHRSQAEMDDYLVCGDIGGVMLGADELPVALAPVGLSPWAGIALLDDDGNGTTTVSLSIFEGPGIDTGAQEVPVGPFPTSGPAQVAPDGDGGGTPPRRGDDDDDPGSDDDSGGSDDDDDDDDSGSGGSDDDDDDD